MDAANQAYQKQLALVVELLAKKNELLDPAKSAEATSAIRKFTEQIQNTLQMLGSSATDREKQLAALANKHGFGSGSSELLQAAEAVRKLDVAEAVENFVKAVNDQTQRIENSHLDDDEFKALKMGEGEMPIENWARMNEALRDKRAAEAVAAFQQMIDDMEPAKLMGGSTTGAFSFGNASQYFGGGGGPMQDIKKAVEKQNELTEQLIAALRNVPLARL